MRTLSTLPMRMSFEGVMVCWATWQWFHSENGNDSALSGSIGRASTGGQIFLSSHYFLHRDLGMFSGI